ncbi:MAG TPA: ISL3 family transposase, partial [Chloroflexota bacterium]|nr:ISL3 family transposase [Chloroflexota bacterium]
MAGAVVWLEAQGCAEYGHCPACGRASDYVHDRYVRRPVDLPWRGRVVRLQLGVRRFRCLNSGCPQRTFAEDFGPALHRYARRTAEATAMLLHFALAGGGEAGARLARDAGLPTSPDTLLRLLRHSGEQPAATPRVLGVDDFALRRGHRYGTILVDLETRRPIDLLPDREADTLATWLRSHPDVTIVVRDRAEAYAEGARRGAPAAQQVADRFHLVQNASAALEELLRSRRRLVALVAPPPSPEAAATEARPLSAAQRLQAERRTPRLAKWEEIRARRAAAQSISQIARELGLERKTVRRYLATRAPPPAPYAITPRPGGLASPTLQPFVPYLQDRWQAGCTNGSQLFRELVGRGYTGSYALLREALRPWRPPRPRCGTRRRPGRRQSLRWLCLRPPEQLSSDEQAALARVLAADADLARGYELVQRFRRVVHARDVVALDAWLTDAQQSDLPPFVSLANGLRGDRAAVEAALTLPWSNGPVEGHVHRLKLIKRQGYGRAKLDLLRRRVL